MGFSPCGENVIGRLVLLTTFPPLPTLYDVGLSPRGDCLTGRMMALGPSKRRPLYSFGSMLNRKGKHEKVDCFNFNWGFFCGMFF